MKSIRLSHLLVITFAIGLLLTVPTDGSAKWWDKFGEPKYGGTISLRVSELSTMQFDTAGPPVMSGSWWLYFDNLFNTDWTVDRSEWSFTVSYTPVKYMVGSLVETWEMPDPETAVLHLRQGVHFQDKPPANGRELVAEDVVYHYDRLMGTGHGFTGPSVYYTTFATNTFKSATANDKYTVTIKFKTPSVLNLDNLMEMTTTSYVEAPEWSALGPPPTTASAGGGPPPPPGTPGPSASTPINDWRNCVGTGPWILADYVEGSSLRFNRNPNYWGYDERHPKNQLPYADEISVLCIPDNTTALAALRSGKIDVLTGVTWQQAETLAKSNPELLQSAIPSAGPGIHINLNNKPFTDINVRKALQLAIDIKTIVDSYYGGTVDNTPCGVVNPLYKDYAYTYEEWPQELKDEYAYNPEKAKKLLADAGFPDGFNTSIVCSQTQDLQLLQILQSMFRDIGVEVETSLMDMAAYTQFIMNFRHEAMIGPEPNAYGGTGMPWTALRKYTTFFRNPTTVKDPVMDDMFMAIQSSSDPAKMVQQLKEAQRYALEHHWGLMVAPQTVTYHIYQPYLKGYSGELVAGMGSVMGYYARSWLDK